MFTPNRFSQSLSVSKAKSSFSVSLLVWLLFYPNNNQTTSQFLEKKVNVTNENNLKKKNTTKSASYANLTQFIDKFN